MMKKIISLLCLLAFLPIGVAHATGDDIVNAGDESSTSGSETPGDESETVDPTDPTDPTDPEPEPEPEPTPVPDPDPEPTPPENLITANKDYTDSGETLTFKDIIVDDYSKYQNDSDSLYIDSMYNNSGDSSLTLNTASNIEASNQLLVADGRTLTITRYPDLTNGAAYDLTFGSVDVAGTLYAYGVGTFTVGGTADITGAMTLNAQNIDIVGKTTIGGFVGMSAEKIQMGATTVNSGATLNVGNTDDFSITGTTVVNGSMSVLANTISLTGTTATTVDNGGVLTLDTTGAGTSSDTDSQNSLSLSGLVNNATTNLTSATILSTGDISNNADGVMNIAVTGSMGVDGAISNDGTMNFTGGGALTVDQTITNTGTMEMYKDAGLGSLTAGEIILSGNSVFNAVISGATSVTNGFDLSGMSNTGTFTLETNEFAVPPQFKWTENGGFGTDIYNTLDSFTLAVATGELTLNDLNNAARSNLDYAAKLTLAAPTINATSIMNYGTMTIAGYTSSVGGATYAVKDIKLTNNIQNYAGVLTLGADDGLSAADVINYGGSMILNGQNSLTVNRVSIESGSAQITSSSSGGTLQTGVVENTGGKLTIASDTLTTGGISLSAGTTDIAANGTMNISSISATGGNLTMDVNGGSGTGVVKIGAGLNVNGGQVDFGHKIDSVDAVASVYINGNLLGGESIADGAGNVNVHGNDFTLTSGSGITIGQNIYLTTTDADDEDSEGYAIKLDSTSITVNGGAYADGPYSTLQFGGTANTGTLDVNGAAIVSNGAKMVLNANSTHVGSLSDNIVDANGEMVGSAGVIDAYGTTIAALNDGGINLAGGLRFDGNSDTTGLNILGSESAFTLQTLNKDADINIGGGVSVADKKELTISSGHDLTVGGTITMVGDLNAIADNSVTFGNTITNTGSIGVTAANGDIKTQDIVNSSTMNLTSTFGNIETGAITHTDGTSGYDAKYKLTSGPIDISGGDLTITAQSASVDSITASDVSLFKIDVDDGIVSIDKSLVMSNTNLPTGNSTSIIQANDLTVGNNLTLNSGWLNLDVDNISVQNAIRVETGSLYLGDGSSANSLWLSGENGVNVSAYSLYVDGDFYAYANQYAPVGKFTFVGDAEIGGMLDVYENATVDITANMITVGGYVINDGALSLTSTATSVPDAVVMTLGTVRNEKTLALNSGNGIVSVEYFLNDYTGTTELRGRGLTSASGFQSDGILRQGASVSADAGDVAILSKNYTISLGNNDKFVATGIAQESGNHMTINASDIWVYADKTLGNKGDIIGSDITFVATNPANWINAKIDGGVSGGTSFIGLGNMTVGGKYIFSDASRINAAIQSDSNYWATVTTAEGSDFGTITNNSDNASALITVGGQFISTQGIHGDGVLGGELPDASVGIVLRDMVEQGSAIWLVHSEYAGDKPLDEQGDKLRNVNVMFCNADGSQCFNYYSEYNPAMDNLPAYLSVRDTNNDGKNDSLYVVFDPRFGGPVSVFKIQPVVGETNPHDDNEYTSAGALDNLIAGKLQESGFYNRTPIEAIPVIFNGTNMEELMNQLYARMERFLVDRDGTALTRFSRLVTPREVENLVGSVALNEHTNFRDLEDRMMNEFIWNRNRRLKNAWLDVDFGIFTQNTSDDKNVDGNRFSIAGGFDWQYDRRTIFGLTARVSHMSMDNPDSFDLGYLPGQPIAGNIDVSVDNTNIGIGGYMIKTLNPKMRLYGNLFADMHMLSVSRDMNYMSKIKGDGNAYAITTEWGLMHDWLNQYIVGNLYARAGYNTGFSITEKSAGADYMKLESDGYVLLAPGYTLTAQKRIYPSAWVQIRPYVSAGVEYDVLGMPDNVQYKFASASDYTDYRVDIDPLWANFGGGVDVLSVRGYQVGLDYRYQYNTDIRMHNIKVSGSYRF